MTLTSPFFADSDPRLAERAADDLRRAAPVVIADATAETDETDAAPDGGATDAAASRADARPPACAVVVAAELVDARLLEALRGWGRDGAHLTLSPARAAALKMRRYTADAVTLPLDPAAGRDAAFARALCDTTRDLAGPLRGPFIAGRAPPPAPYGAAIRLAKIAELLPAAVVAPLRLAPAAAEAWATARRLSWTSVAAIEAQTAARAALDRVVGAPTPLRGAEDARLVLFRPRAGGHAHVAVVIGEPPTDQPVLTRIHSECFTGDVLDSLKCDCGPQLAAAIRRMRAAGGGVLLYLRQEGRGIGLANKLRAYELQHQGWDTVEANQRLGFADDERNFDAAAAMLRGLGYRQVRLLTNNPRKVEGLRAAGVEVAAREPHLIAANPYNARYLATKAEKSGHVIPKTS